MSQPKEARRVGVSFPVTEPVAKDLSEILPELFASSTEFSVRLEGNLVHIDRKHRREAVPYDG